MNPLQNSQPPLRETNPTTTSNSFASSKGKRKEQATLSRKEEASELHAMANTARSRSSSASIEPSCSSSSAGPSDPNVHHLHVCPDSAHDTTSDSDSIRHCQQTLANMRRHIPELAKEEIDMHEVQTFVTTIYHAQISLVAAMAEKNLEARGISCPVGDKWCILGLGSLGRGDVNPYSDLDFAILVDKSTPQTEKYFMAFVTEMANIVDELQDKGMHVCKGGVTPPYMHHGKECGSKDLIGTPRTLAHYAMNRILDTSLAKPGMNAYSLMQVGYVHGNSKLADRFMNAQRRQIGKRMLNKDAQHHFQDVEASAKKGNKKCSHRTGEALGKRMLMQGNDFWIESRSIRELDHGPEMADKLGWKATPYCDIKKSILRPIQNSAQGLATYHGIYEPNPLNAIDRLVEKGVMDKNLGEEVKELYKAASGIRVRLELTTQKEKTVVTRCPDHIRCKTAEAQLILDHEHEMLKGAQVTLLNLEKLVNTFL